MIDISSRCIGYAVAVLEFTILGLLKERPMHGYDLRKRMREEFSALENLSFGSLYPALGRLEAGGDIRTVASTDSASGGDPVPFTGSIGGERATTVPRRTALAAFGGRGTRARKIYEITASGELLFDRLLDSADEKDDPRSFSLRLAFARHLSPAARMRLLERHQLALTRRLARTNHALVTPARPLDRYQRSIAEHARDGIVADLAWLSALVDEETAISTPAPSAAVRHKQQPQTDSLEPAAAGAMASHDGGTQ
jgi:DNA-binding PadR family transcriptional regulator